MIVTPAQLLLAIAEHETLQKTCATFPGLTREVAQKLLRGAARQLQLEGRPVHLLGVDGAGFADLDALPPDAGLVALGLANNEVGTVQPVSELAAV